jgi:hypothetical protein
MHSADEVVGVPGWAGEVPVNVSPDAALCVHSERAAELFGGCVDGADEGGYECSVGRNRGV